MKDIFTVDFDNKIKIVVLKNICIKFCRTFTLYNFPFGALFLAEKLVWKLAFFQLLLSKPKHKSDNFYKRHGWNIFFWPFSDAPGYTLSEIYGL